jgi:hypothetical protein
MKRYPIPLTAALGLVLVAGAVLATHEQHAQGTVYTVTQVQAGLAEHPRAWLGWTMRVRGLVVPCQVGPDDPPNLPPSQSCSGWPADLVDPGSASAAAFLPLTWSLQSPLLAALRRLPLLGPLLPAPAAPTRTTITTYRVRLRVAPSAVCSSTPCYEALVLDTAW